MEDFETRTKEVKNGYESSKRDDVKERFVELLRRVILFICCGPGVLGFLWLIGRILRR